MDQFFFCVIILFLGVGFCFVYCSGIDDIDVCIGCQWVELCCLVFLRLLERFLSNGDLVLWYRYFCYVDYGDFLISDCIFGVLVEFCCFNLYVIVKFVIWWVMVGVFVGE